MKPKKAALDKSTTGRLAFSKYLYNLGVEQSTSAEPMNSVSLLMMHDAVELFLQAACEYLDIGKPQVEFMAYWDVLKDKLPDGGLSQRESMRRLNKARVALKHQGTMPSRLDIEAFRASVTNFFEENTPRVFGVQFATISLIDLVACEPARSKLKEAQREIEEHKIEAALSDCCLAFHFLLDDYEDRIMNRLGESTVFSDHMESLRRHGGHHYPELQDFVDNIRELFDYLHDTVKILSLGIDYQKYVKFTRLTPNATKMSDGHYEVTWRRRRGAKNDLTKHHADYCLSFVIEAALVLQRMDLES
jgi:hypothetical protein